MTIHLYNVRWRTLLLRLRTSRTTIQLSYMNAKTYIQDPTMTVPLVRCSALPMFEGHPLIVTAQLEASQVELTVLHKRNGASFFKPPSPPLLRTCRLHHTYRRDR